MNRRKKIGVDYLKSLHHGKTLMNERCQNLHFPQEIFLNIQCINVYLLSFTQASDSNLIVIEEIRIFPLLILSKIVEIIASNMLSGSKVI